VQLPSRNGLPQRDIRKSRTGVNLCELGTIHFSTTDNTDGTDNELMNSAEHAIPVEFLIQAWTERIKHCHRRPDDGFAQPLLNQLSFHANRLPIPNPCHSCYQWSTYLDQFVECGRVWASRLERIGLLPETASDRTCPDSGRFLINPRVSRFGRTPWMALFLVVESGAKIPIKCGKLRCNA
jgi:hypothetical protein